MRFTKAIALAAGLAACVPAIAHSENQALAFGAVRPSGWMLEQMQNDLQHGFVGRLDRLASTLILDDDIYGRDRLTKLVKAKDVGTHTTGADWEVQFLWWNSETQSNWWDGYLRTILLTADEALKSERLDTYVRDKLATADADGYIGIYGPDLRYQHSTENGELWAQASLFRGLLAYYEATGDAAVLDAVQKAVDLTIESWPIDASEPFNMKDPFAGVGHGLMFVDVLDTLARISGDNGYLDYAVFLFEDYNRHEQPEADIQLHNLMDPEYRFEGHGVHTYEHLRALTIAAYHTGRDDYQAALDRYLTKLDTVLTASGGPIGDEWVFGRHAHPSETGYEFCSLQELLHSYSLLLEKSGDAKWADRMEWLLYNAAQGARHPNGRSIAYVKTDNAFQAMGHIDADKPQNEERFKYSPVHQDVAVCCVPNAGRIYPYFVQAMYHRAPRGINVNLFGASEMSTRFNDVPIRIRQVTDYPFSGLVRLKVEAETQSQFDLNIRMPAWAKGVEINGANYEERGDWLTISKDWEGETKLDVRFEREVTILDHSSGTVAVAHGPLLYALPIEHEEIAGKDYGESGFHDVYAKPTQEVDLDWALSRGANFTLTAADDRVPGPFDSLALKGKLYNQTLGRKCDVELVPIGGTVLRQVSFAPETRIAGEQQ